MVNENNASIELPEAITPKKVACYILQICSCTDASSFVARVYVKNHARKPGEANAELECFVET